VGHGSGWIYIVSLNTNIFNFTTEDRGKVLGLLVCCFGLSSGIFSLIYKAFFSKDVVFFLFFLSIALPLVAMVAGFIFVNFLHEFPKNYKTQVRRIYWGYGIMLGVALWISVSSLVTHFTGVSSLPFCIVMLGLIGLLFSLPARTPEGVVLLPPSEEDRMLVSAVELNQKPNLGEESNLLTSVRQIEFWLIFFTFFAVIGSGITILNNITELVYSLQTSLHNGEVISRDDLPNADHPTTFITMFSVFNTFGRLTVGILSDQYLKKFSRTAWLCATASLMALTQVLYLVSTIPMIFGVIMVHGLAYGGTFAVIPTLISEFFGLKHFGANYGFIGIAPAVGSELLSTLLAGQLNDHFKQSSYFVIGKDRHCLGRDCYRYAIISNFFLCLLAIAASFVIKARYWSKTKRNSLEET